MEPNICELRSGAMTRGDGGWSGGISGLSLSGDDGWGDDASSYGGRDLDCDQVNGPVRVGGYDPNNLDADGDGIGCE